MRVDPIHVRTALAGGRQGDTLGIPVKREAAVALVLHVGQSDTEVLLIRRAERAGDPWSGHMALPGGHREPEDEDSRATAMRETFEEVGVLLDSATHLGTLSPIQAMVRGVHTGTLITPHVFLLRDRATLRPNQEVAEVFWAPLGPMAQGQYDTVKVVEREGRRLEFPAIRVDRHLVWGLTHRMLSELFSVLKAEGRGRC